MIPGMNVKISNYLRRYPEDRERLSLLLDQVLNDTDYGSRSNMVGHVVSSVITLDPSRAKALLIHHRAYGIWIPPGGHYENDGTSLYWSARRERKEETGLADSRPAGGYPFLLDIDTHAISPRPEKSEGAHFHHDFMYLDLCDQEYTPKIQPSEILAADWKCLNVMLAEGGRMQRLAERISNLPSSFLL